LKTKNPEQNAQASKIFGIDCVHPSKLRFENKESRTKCSSKLGHFVRDSLFIRDREGIRTPNPQSRNLIFYPVELRSLILKLRTKLKVSLQ
jgi:hypothetical protein